MLTTQQFQKKFKEFLKSSLKTATQQAWLFFSYHMYTLNTIKKSPTCSKELDVKHFTSLRSKYLPGCLFHSIFPFYL